MNRMVADFLSLAVIAATVITTLVLYPDLPDPMPTHWNAAGQVDGYMSRPWGVSILPFAAILIFVLLKFLPKLSRKGYDKEVIGPSLSLLQLVLVIFMSGVAILVLMEAKGHDTGMDRLIPGGIGVLFLVIGSQFGKVQRNYLLGIRTPWTLASDDTWNRTHKVGSKLFMLAGLVLLASSLIEPPLVWTLPIVFALLLFPVLYSYFIHRKARQTGIDSGA